jgi:uncharacterized membrane protein YbhN (UPF0104 family)
VIADRRRLWTVVQAILLVITLAWVGRALARQWDDVRAVAMATNLHWGWITLASVMVLGTYAILIQSWRLLLAGWGGHLTFAQAARIWTIANLGRYIPGKLWSVGALGVLARQEGVSGVAAAGAAILGTLLNIGAGFGVLAFSGARVLGTFAPWLQSAAIGIGVAFVLGTLALPRLLPHLLERVARWRGMEPPRAALPAGTLWLAVTINAVSWLCYGLAFTAFTRGVVPHVAANPATFTAIWTASYLLGYLVLFAPAGIGVRDGLLTGGLIAVGVAVTAEASWITMTSRIWLTVCEVLPGLLALSAVPILQRRAKRRAP